MASAPSQGNSLYTTLCVWGMRTGNFPVAQEGVRTRRGSQQQCHMNGAAAAAAQRIPYPPTLLDQPTMITKTSQHMCMYVSACVYLHQIAGVEGSHVSCDAARQHPTSCCTRIGRTGCSTVVAKLATTNKHRATTHKQASAALRQTLAAAILASHTHICTGRCVTRSSYCHTLARMEQGAQAAKAESIMLPLVKGGAPGEVSGCVP